MRKQAPASGSKRSAPANRTRRDVQVFARHHWNATGVTLDPDRAYDLTVRGRWTDAYIATDATGFERWWLRLAKRWLPIPTARWFALIGRVGPRGAPFLIGRGRHGYRPAEGGELYCCANDLPFMYWNNRGALVLTIGPARRAHAGRRHARRASAMGAVAR
jgi:hypothetical protein